MNCGWNAIPLTASLWMLSPSTRGISASTTGTLPPCNASLQCLVLMNSLEMMLSRVHVRVVWDCSFHTHRSVCVCKYGSLSRNKTCYVTTRWHFMETCIQRSSSINTLKQFRSAKRWNSSGLVPLCRSGLGAFGSPWAHYSWQISDQRP